MWSSSVSLLSRSTKTTTKKTFFHSFSSSHSNTCCVSTVNWPLSVSRSYAPESSLSLNDSIRFDSILHSFLGPCHSWLWDRIPVFVKWPWEQFHCQQTLCLLHCQILGLGVVPFVVKTKTRRHGVWVRPRVLVPVQLWPIGMLNQVWLARPTVAARAFSSSGVSGP